MTSLSITIFKRTRAQTYNYDRNRFRHYMTYWLTYRKTKQTVQNAQIYIC